MNQILEAIAADLNATPVFGSCLEQIRQANRDEAAAKNAAYAAASEALCARRDANRGILVGSYRVRELSKKDGGGFNVEQLSRDYNWVKVTYCPNKAAAERAMALRSK